MNRSSPQILAIAAAGTPLREVRTGDDVVHLFHSDARIRVVNIWATWCAPCVAGDAAAR